MREHLITKLCESLCTAGIPAVLGSGNAHVKHIKKRVVDGFLIAGDEALHAFVGISSEQRIDEHLVHDGCIPADELQQFGLQGGELGDAVGVAAHLTGINEGGQGGHEFLIDVVTMEFECFDEAGVAVEHRIEERANHVHTPALGLDHLLGDTVALEHPFDEGLHAQKAAWREQIALTRFCREVVHEGRSYFAHELLDFEALGGVGKLWRDVNKTKLLAGVVVNEGHGQLNGGATRATHARVELVGDELVFETGLHLCIDYVDNGHGDRALAPWAIDLDHLAGS